MRSIILFLALNLLFISDCFSWNRKSRELFRESSDLSSSRWVSRSRSHKNNILNLFEHLKKSKTGARIIKLAKAKAAKENKSIFDVISPGEVSICDTTLVRKFSVNDPMKVFYESKSQVYVGRDLSIKGAVLDIAHELTHYIFRPPFNPYNDKFSMSDFISSTIEGTGGEVDAYMVECKVLYDLFPSEVERNSSCSKIVDKRTNRLTRSKAVESFYRVGHGYKRFLDQIKVYGLKTSDFPYLTSRDASIISAAHDSPYPIAAYKEYLAIMKRACGNDEKRVAIVRKKIGRRIASTNESKSKLILGYNSLKKSYLKRCHIFEK